MNRKVSLTLTFICAVFTACASGQKDYESKGASTGTEEDVMYFEDFKPFDSSVWTKESHEAGRTNEELQAFSPEQVKVGKDGGRSVLMLTAEWKNGKIVSGRINSKGKKSFRYGTLSASIRLPKTADGLWHAVWMMGDVIKEGGWPACGETDVLEMGHADGIMDGTQERLFNGALHWGVSSDKHCQQVAAGKHQPSLQDGEFHIYTVVWTPTRIEMFVDNADKPYLSAAIGKNSDKHAFFNKANFLLFNLAVGGDFPNIHNADNVTAIPAGGAEMLVDYERVYQPKKQISLNIKK